jgi:hypothetical protein
MDRQYKWSFCERFKYVHQHITSITYRETTGSSFDQYIDVQSYIITHKLPLQRPLGLCFHSKTEHEGPHFPELGHQIEVQEPDNTNPK